MLAAVAYLCGLEREEEDVDRLQRLVRGEAAAVAGDGRDLHPHEGRGQGDRRAQHQVLRRADAPAALVLHATRAIAAADMVDLNVVAPGDDQ